MSIDFHAPTNRFSYAGREAQPDWAAVIRSLVDPAAKRVADIGCGGGIYSAAWADLGAAEVTGVDFSAEMVRTASERNRGRPNIVFKQGDARATGLASDSADIVFERALIHHLKDYDACFREAARLLVGGGLAIVQDRTPEDVALAGAPEHIRGYFFECFPRLLETEKVRRPTEQAVERALRGAGFGALQTVTVWETRKRHDDFRGLAADLRGRVGRSILHALTDGELNELVDFIGRRLPANAPVVEKDRWTIWSGTKA
ncbi:MAG: class I SAM-dependent methyltransferase [Reyranella sp.]|nr:class I SAM-dependent methyltransferase [Reyranella sp.]